MCPFVDKADVRCSAHLTFRNLFSAFEHCADRYNCCRVYGELMHELPPGGKYEPCRAPQRVLVAS